MSSVLTLGLNLEWQVGDTSMDMYTLSHKGHVLASSVVVLR